MNGLRTPTDARPVGPAARPSAGAVFVDPTGVRLRRWRLTAGASSIILVVLLLLVLVAALSDQQTRLPEPRWAPASSGPPVPADPAAAAV